MSYSNHIAQWNYIVIDRNQRLQVKFKRDYLSIENVKSHVVLMRAPYIIVRLVNLSAIVTSRENRMLPIPH